MPYSNSNSRDNGNDDYGKGRGAVPAADEARRGRPAADPLVLEPAGPQDAALAHPDAMLTSSLWAPDFGAAEAAFDRAEARAAGMVGYLDFATEDSARASLAAVCSVYASARQSARADLHRQCEQALSSVDRLVGSWEGTTLGLRREIAQLEAQRAEAEEALAALLGRTAAAPAPGEP